VVDQMSLDREPDTQRYRMLVGVLRTLEERPSPLVVPAFFWKLSNETSVEKLRARWRM
jgi:DNA repair protein RecO (recombination protein O)